MGKVNLRKLRRGKKSVEFLQESISTAVGMLFESAAEVETQFESNNGVMELTCIANGITARLTMYESAMMEERLPARVVTMKGGGTK